MGTPSSSSQELEQRRLTSNCRTSCDTCATGDGPWRTCNQAPNRANESVDVLGGACPNCFLAGRGSQCRRTPGPQLETILCSGDEGASQLQHIKKTHPAPEAMEPPFKKPRLTGKTEPRKRDVTSQPQPGKAREYPTRYARRPCGKCVS